MNIRPEFSQQILILRYYRKVSRHNPLKYLVISCRIVTCACQVRSATKDKRVFSMNNKEDIFLLNRAISDLRMELDKEMQKSA